MINRSVLVGRITKDPELKKTQSGKSVVSFTLAVNRKHNKDETDFINCVAWNNQADFLANYVTKGALLGVEGRIQTRNYEDNTGRKVYITEVVVDSVQALESRSQREGNQTAAVTSETHYPSYDNRVDDGPVLDITSDDLPF